MALHFKLLIALTLCTLSVSGQFETSSDYMIYYEVIYVVKGDYISVCVAQTKPNQFPFMSALEVRSLDSNMYSKIDSNLALFLQNRTAYGADSSIRFSSDLYDRIWEPANIEAGQLAVASTAIIIRDSNYADKPPQVMLQNAITTRSTSDPIILDTGLPAISSKIYINFYFSEVAELDSTQRRSFTVYNNNQSHSAPSSHPTSLRICVRTLPAWCSLWWLPRIPTFLLLSMAWEFSLLTDGTNIKVLGTMRKLSSNQLL